VTIFGVHTGPANTTLPELQQLWRRIEDGPFEWISVWDHFYAADGDSTTCIDGVVAHTALAVSTTRVRCGCLVYCAAYRHPGVLANAMAAIDHLSHGRCDVGIGAGWLRAEFDAYGIPFPGAAERLDLMEESVRCVRALLREPAVTFAGHHVTLADAIVDPRPLQAELPVWVGGGGERRTLRIAAELADGWNVPFISPEEFARKSSVLDEHCAAVGRDPGAVRRSVNVGCAPTEESLARQFGAIAEFVRPGVLMGSEDQLVDGIGRYVDAGADQVNLALRAPFELSALDHLARAVGQFDRS
jgi:alkanesulfonate monooxygenase SsuD/methylene tetrahydromethanopterin reductase-like flavin-dependent oxidoreductase (luciferase family)